MGKRCWAGVVVAITVAVGGGSGLRGQETPPATKLDSAGLAALIDSHLERRLAAEKIQTAGAADDAEILRRLTLDLHGVIPLPEDVRHFLDDGNRNKRSVLIDRLLADPAYGQYLADLWCDQLLPLNAENRKVPTAPLRRWLAEQFNENRSWDRTVHELLTAHGPQYENGAVTLFMTNSKSLEPHEATDIVSRVFLGIRLQCAQCHKHPFADWTQTDYWGLAAFFEKVQFTSKFDDGVDRKPPPGHKDDVGTNYGITEVVNAKRRNRPERAIAVPPRFLTGESAVAANEPPLRPMLAEWLVSPKNPWFARAMVNRTWAHFFGRGIVNPPDDLRAENLPTHPGLLEELTQQFVAHNFDLKYLVRAIVSTRAYQRTSAAAESNDHDALYARMTIKVLSPKQTFDGLVRVLGEETFEDSKGLGFQRDKFVQFFESDDEPDPTAYRRGIPQLLLLMNAKNYRAGIDQAAERLVADLPPAEAIDRLYLAALSRKATPAEQAKMQEFVADHQGKLAAGYSGILWTLLSTSEFAVNH